MWPISHVTPLSGLPDLAQQAYCRERQFPHLETSPAANEGISPGGLRISPGWTAEKQLHACSGSL